MSINLSEAGDFTRTIVAAKEDNAPRLVYADWLQEQGLDDYADFIRWQVKYPTVEYRYAPAWGNYKHFGMSISNGSGTKEESAHPHREWFMGHAAEVCKLFPTENWTYVWRRGFVCGIWGPTASEWLDNCDQLTKAFPLTKVELRTRLSFSGDRPGGPFSGQTRERQFYLYDSDVGQQRSTVNRRCRVPPMSLKHLYDLSGLENPLPYLIHKEWPDIEIVNPPEPRDDWGRWRNRQQQSQRRFGIPDPLLAGTGVSDDDY